MVNNSNQQESISEEEKLNLAEKEKLATERIKEIDLVLRMVEVGFNGKKVYYKRQRIGLVERSGIEPICC